MTTTVDKFGRVVIPKRLRSRLGLDEGAAVAIEEHADGLLLRAADAQNPLVRARDGLLVFRCRLEKGATDRDVLRAVTKSRHERMTQVAGMPVDEDSD